MSDVLHFPSRLSGRELNQIFRFGAVGELEILLMQTPGDEPAPVDVVMRAGSVVVEIASFNDDVGMKDALWTAHKFAESLLITLQTIKARGVLRDAFLGPHAPDDGEAA